MKKVFVNVKLNDEQKKRLETISNDYEFVYERSDDANIIVGNYPPEKLKEFKNLEWIQTSAVGVDAFVKKGILNDNTILTNAVGVHSQEVAEHIVGLLMSLLKNIHLYKSNQNKNLWHDEGRVKSIKGLKVSIIGFGDIGNALAKILKGMGMYVIAVKRKMVTKPEYVDELYTNNDMDKAITNVDAIITVLPGIPENTHLFTVDTFKKMKPDTILVNAGRGNLYSEETLCEVLENRIIKAIAMDVFEKEPVPEDSKLWKYDNLLITPHVAGFFHLESALEEYVDLVEENLKHYINGEPLKCLVNEREK